MKEKKKMSLLAKQSAAGWVFLTPATILIAIMAFWPMVQAFIMSLQTGSSANLQWNDPIFNNYTRMFSDKVFMTSVGNTFLYLIIQVPIMLVLAILLAQLLNNQHLRFKGFFRTCVFLPCATSLVSYALIFRFLFAQAMEDEENMRLVLEIILGRELALKQCSFSEVVISETGGISTVYANDGGVVAAY